MVHPQGEQLYPFILEMSLLSLLMYIVFVESIMYDSHMSIFSLSWADTATSMFGCLYGAYRSKLPARLLILHLLLASWKSLVGFLAATLTEAGIALTFWGFAVPLHAGGAQLTWSVQILALWTNRKDCRP